jgi:hypothetical protein
MIDQCTLSSEIERILQSLEERGEIVVCSSTPGRSAKVIAEAVSALVPNAELTASEMQGIRSLILHAVADKSFFDWEMPTLTGLSAEEFRKLADKLPS